MMRANSRRIIHRRKVLGIFAAAACLPLGIGLGRAAGSIGSHEYRWRGRALGVEAEMRIFHPDLATVEKAVTTSVAEIDRLESIFSLYRGDSELVRLNRDGRLDRVTPELRAVLAEARRISEISNGAFDITVQPLWKLHRRHFAHGTFVENDEIQSALQLVGYRGVELSGHKVRLSRPGMALTLNGIAQGYITDRIADLLRDHGFDRVLLQLGETFGIAPTDAPWRIGVEGWQNRPGDITVPLVSAAIATSMGNSTPLGAQIHHIFDPRGGGPTGNYRSVSVVADRALTADALSTAIYAAPSGKAAHILSNGGGRQAYVVTNLGESHRF
ncbi:MAG: FAD:protein FMN transferase [Rhodospirillales bacterium]|nr:FAD:protein FMN transferase [Rhodospirillales bacterium]